MSKRLDYRTLILAWALGIFFFLQAFVKLVNVNRDITKALVRQFKHYASTSPLLLLGIQLQPNTYQMLVGLCELQLGGMLLVGWAQLKRFASLGLLLLLGYAIVVQLQLGERIQVLTPSVLLLALYHLYRRTGRTEQRDAATDTADHLHSEPYPCLQDHAEPVYTHHWYCANEASLCENEAPHVEDLYFDNHRHHEKCH